MSNQNQQSNPGRLRSVMEIMDEEYMTNGDGSGRKWTREELDAQHRIGDLLDAKLAAGYSVKEINAEWDGKTMQEILAATGANETALQAEEAEAHMENLSERPPSVIEVMDEEFKTNGDHFGKIWTQEELDESRRMSDCYEELLAKGYTEKQIDALWEGKTPQEIIAETSANETAP